MAERLDFKSVEEKWKKKWQDKKVFEANPDKRKKYFVTFPYPYMNGYMHLGHFYTSARVDVTARYKRMQGFNVLFPQAWHCTGSPIENAALRIKEGEEKQVKIMTGMGFSEQEIKKFAEPFHWAKFFPKEFKKDFIDAGMSVDFRREFITTSLNPYYDRFIRWQFGKLKELGYVQKGKHPVVWCTKDNAPVGDHARVEGEGETPQEFTLLKFKFDDSYIVAATLRPETVYGQTNMWVGADIEYVKAKVDGEQWIISEPCTKKLGEQGKTVMVVGKIKGRDMLGKKCRAPGIERDIMILPSHFCDPEKGTGLVTSVPSDAPDDWMGLHDLQQSKEECAKYGLNWEEINKIKPIAIIDSKDLGDMAALKICDDMKIKSQHEREKLEQAKKIVYKKGYYEGTMNKNTGKYAGMPVEKAKELVKNEMIESKKADIFYELTGKVVCRCLTPSIVKIVSDQWFVTYGDLNWKKQVHHAFDNMRLYPEEVRAQFNYVIDWLNDWACTREYGLGTNLPWDEKWVIESLSDSTIYMAYYTIAHMIQDIPLEKLNDEFFDYVFLGKGKKPNIKDADKMKKEFEYWYPLDMRVSGKDLIQNHFTFFVFNHVAIFPEKHWPKGICCNGWLTVDAKKMSKSLGNFLLVRDVLKIGADACRLTLMSGGDGVDDANWDSAFANTANGKLEQLFETSKFNYGKGRADYMKIDEWMESVLNRTIVQATDYMDNIMYRNAIQKAFFDLQSAVKWYLKRTNNNPNKELMKKLVEAQILMIAPITPFVCEEIWESIGKKGFVSTAEWPKCEKKKINDDIEAGEQMISQTLDDIQNVLKLAKIEKPKKIKLFVSPKWKYDFLVEAGKLLAETRDLKIIIPKIMSGELKKYGQEITKMLPKLAKTGVNFKVTSQKAEHEVLKDAVEFLKLQHSCEVEVSEAEKSKEAKAQSAMPGKPAILVE